MVDGREFELKQFHFHAHAPSENTLNGKHFPIDGHLVHADKDGNLAVVAVMFSQGADHPLLPASRDHDAFNGSLTTPPCSECVRWLVVKQPASASTTQIERFSGTVGEANNRPVQPLNARSVLH